MEGCPGYNATDARLRVRVDTTDCPTIGGTLLTISGVDFVVPITVTVVGLRRLDVVSQSSTKIVAKLIPGTGKARTIQVGQTPIAD